MPRRDPLLALVQRSTQGFELGEYQRAQALGYPAYLAEQLEPFTLDDSGLDARLASYTTLGMSPKQLFDGFPDDIGTPIIELKGSLILRAVYSRRQLYERMCEFWRDHFHIDHNKGDVEWALLPEHELTVIRPHALGKFPDMLRASAFSPAMQYYLDNWLNVRGAPQENYARELLELHTLGVHGGYSEVDVKEVAKCFTGWTLNVDSGSPDFLRTVFVPVLHTPGPKFVLGNAIPSSPASENARRVLDLLALHPSTARFIAKKLTAWLLTPAPSAELVERVAATYLATGGDIRAMLRVILARENLAGVVPVLAPKFRRPFHLVTSILRALGAHVSDPLYPLLLLYLMGHPPLDKVTPDGYPDTLAAWGRSLLPRWNAASLLVAGGSPFPGRGTLPGVRFPGERLSTLLELGRRPDPAGLAEKINSRLLGGALDAFEEASLQAFLDERALLLDVDLYEAIALAVSLPGFQWF
ncbi:MAG: DUF1800 domain-containing protein [Planctomycetes bacterium]|nr:DUF1800 domain-containing protein [Planctomycetota bacterium]